PLGPKSIEASGGSRILSSGTPETVRSFGLTTILPFHGTHRMHLCQSKQKASQRPLLRLLSQDQSRAMATRRIRKCLRFFGTPTTTPAIRNRLMPRGLTSGSGSSGGLTLLATSKQAGSDTDERSRLLI